MIAFVVAAAVMAAIAIAWVVVPLLRGGAHASVDRERTNLAILRDQRKELESDLANGTITNDHYDAAARELDRRVLDEAQAAKEAAPAAAPRAGRLTAVLVAVAIPVLASALYALLGTPEAMSPMAMQRQAQGPGQDTHDITPDELDKMLERLAQRLEQEPNNAEGWAVLARSYSARGKPEEAVKAYDKAVALLPNDAGLLADYADTLGAVQGRSLAGKPMELVQRALAADPKQWKALALAGTAAFNAKDYRKAVDYWERVKQSVPPSSPIAQSIDSSIAEARQAGNLGPAPASTPAPAAGAAPPSMAAAAGMPKGAAPVDPNGPNPHAKGFPEMKGGGAAPGAPVDPGPGVGGTVTLAASLAGSAKPDDVVFIFARAAQGSRAPLALIRKKVKELPATFALDDTQAMSPAMRLSGASEVIVGARISKTGEAMPAPGDLEGLSQPVKVGAKNVSVVIDRTLP